VGIVSFPSVKNAIEAVVEILNRSAILLPSSVTQDRPEIRAFVRGVQLHCLELLDQVAMRACNIYFEENNEPCFPEQPALWFRFSGSPGALDDGIAMTKEVVAAFGGGRLTLGETEAEGERLWRARKEIYWSQQVWRDHLSLRYFARLTGPRAEIGTRLQRCAYTSLSIRELG
jgi:D-lactate dehydrogenase (cytochrome)